MEWFKNLQVNNKFVCVGVAGRWFISLIIQWSYVIYFPWYFDDSVVFCNLFSSVNPTDMYLAYFPHVVRTCPHEWDPQCLPHLPHHLSSFHLALLHQDHIDLEVLLHVNQHQYFFQFCQFCLFVCSGLHFCQLCLLLLLVCIFWRYATCTSCCGGFPTAFFLLRRFLFLYSFPELLLLITCSWSEICVKKSHSFR